MIVVDASALLEVLLHTPRGEAIEARLFDGLESLHSPHLLDVEVAQVIRRFEIAGEIEVERAQAALDDFMDLPIQRHPHGFLLKRVWSLRASMTAYDAVYVALAEIMEATFVTHDRRLAAAARRHVTVELV
ncbi:Predicted nucleic acid-binding protein, contains PIN domain [Rhodospirillales bacterium URHD0017]|nr:Predicted nucleic acid-binding protein, contains PIN domain [Rhodospirillales bacterium URHD0017]